MENIHQVESIIPWRSVLYVIVFLVISPLTLAASLFTLSTFEKANEPTKVLSATDSGVQVFASLPSKSPAVSGQVLAADARPEILRKGLPNSPLADYTEHIVETADKYGLDWRLIPAIAIKESGACRVIPPGGHNCWGWGIHSAGTLGFDSYEEGITTVSKGLKENYIDRGYRTVDEIMTKYASPGSTTWAKDVKFYMERFN